jgi:hypothetical protein
MEKRVICNECGKKQNYHDLSKEFHDGVPIYFCDCYSMKLTDLKEGEQVNPPSIVKILEED